jgi:hypothetical protein
LPLVGIRGRFAQRLFVEVFDETFIALLDAGLT